MRNARSLRGVQAFSLTELLVVVGIMILLAAISIPAFTNISRGSNLASAGQMMVDTFSLARQTASTQNRQVEIRFYKLPPSQGAAAPAYCALQLFLVQTNGLQPITRLSYFSGPVVIADDPSKTSTILSYSSGTNAWPLPGIASYQYASFHFLPSGETDLDASRDWFSTLVVSSDKPGADGLPSNYVVTRIDPISGKVIIFRP